MAIQTGSVSFPPLRGGGPRTAQATVVFPRAVLHAAAGLTNYAVGFSGSDHHLGQLQIGLDPVVSGDAVTVNVTYGLRDWSGDWDDDYTGDIEFAVLAELISPTAPPPRDDVIVTGAEFNQATQFFQSARHLDAEHAMPDNSIRLIGGKNLGIRAYVDYDAIGTTAPISSLSGELRLHASSGATTTIAPLAAIVPRAAIAIDRGNVGHTLNFLVPGVWCEGLLDIEITVFDAAHPTPRSLPFARTLRFIDVTPLEVHAVAIHYTGQGLDLPAPTVSDVMGVLDFTERVYPVGQVQLAGYQAQDYGRDLRPSDDGNDTPGYDGILDMLEDLRGGGDELFVGLLPQGGIDTSIDTTGWSIDGIERSGVGVSFIGDGSAVAHEIGHAFGRDHAPCDDSGRCDDPDSPDGGYPHYGTYPSDSIGEYGFDPLVTGGGSVFDPATTFDFMGYSSTTWISPYTYAALMGALPDTGGGPQGSATAQKMLRRRPRSDGKGGARQGIGLHLRLMLAPDGKMTLQPSFSHEVVRVPMQGCGDWKVEQRGKDGAVLYCVTLDVREACDCNRKRLVRQRISHVDGARTLAVLHRGKEVLVENFDKAPTIKAQLKHEQKKDQNVLEVHWSSDDADVWVLVQGEDARGVWRGLAPRTQDPCIVLPAATLAKRRIQKLRLLAVRKLTTAVVELAYDAPPVTAGGEIVTRMVAPGVIKGWAIGDDGAERGELRWSDEHGTALGRGHTLDLRQQRRVSTLRVSIVGGQRLIPSRVITLAGPSARPTIGSDAVAGRWGTSAIGPHRGKPDHDH